MHKKRQLRLNNVHSTRNSIAFLVREYWKNETDEEENGYWWRTLCSLMDLHLKSLQQERLSEFDERIAKIESFIEDYRYDQGKTKGD